MNIRLFGFLLFISFIFAILDSFISGATPQGSALANVLNTQIINIHEQSLLFTTVPVPLPNLGFIGSVLDLATLNFSFFSGPFVLMRLAIIVPMYGMLLYSMTLTIGPIIISAAAVIANLLRKIL